LSNFLLIEQLLEIAKSATHPSVFINPKPLLKSPKMFCLLRICGKYSFPPFSPWEESGKPETSIRVFLKHLSKQRG